MFTEIWIINHFISEYASGAKAMLAGGVSVPDDYQVLVQNYKKDNVIIYSNQLL